MCINLFSFFWCKTKSKQNWHLASTLDKPKEGPISWQNNQMTCRFQCQYEIYLYAIKPKRPPQVA